MPLSHADTYAPNEISYSMISSWLWCRQEYELKYRQGLQPIVSDLRPTRGDAVHYALALAILKGNERWLNPAINVWRDEQLQAMNNFPMEIYREAEQLVIEAADEARIVAQRAYRNIDFDRWETVLDHEGNPMVEVTLGLGLAAYHKTVVGTMDWVARDRRSGLPWLWDFKTREQFQPDKSEDVNLQNALYQYLLLNYGIDTVGSVTYQIHASPPVLPKLNNNGTVSRARIRTDWDSYAEFCRSVGQDPALYEEEMRPKLDAEFFRPIVAYRQGPQLENIWQRIVIPAVSQMTALDSLSGPELGFTIIRSMSHRNCNGCSVRDVCMADLYGADADYIRRARFTTRQQRQAQVTEQPERTTA